MKKNKFFYLVTGGAGFIGTNLIKKLLEDKQKVVSFDNYSTGLKENEQKGCEYIDIDLANVKDYEFLKDKTIRSGGKIYASFNPEEWTVKRSLKKLSFWQTGIFGALDTVFGRDEIDVTSINLTYDEDVILHLINKLIGGVS